MPQETQLRVEIDTTGQATRVRRLRGELRELGDAGDTATRSTTALTRSLKLAGGALAGIAGGAGISKLVQDVSQLEDINSLITGFTGDLASSTEFLRATTAELSGEYITLANGYAQLLPLYDAQVISLERAQELTKGLATAQVATNRSNADLQLSYRGLSQTLSAGTVNYEDYKQVTEPLPGLNAKIAQSFGLTTGELKKLISTGALTSQEFGDKAVEAFKTFESAAAASVDNISKKLNLTRNAYTEVVTAFSEPVGEGAVASAEALTVVLESIAENADAITVAVGAAGAVVASALGGQAVSALSRLSAGQVEAARSSALLRAETVASTRAAAAEASTQLIRAQNARAIAAADLQAAQARAASIGGFRRLSFVANELAVAERAAATATTQLSVAQRAVTATSASAAAAQRAASVSAVALAAASRAASASLALIGGPAGAAFLAAAGLVFLANRETEASRSAKELSDAMKTLARDYKANAAAARESADATIESQESNLVALKQRYEELKVARDTATVSLRDGVSSESQAEQSMVRLSAQIKSATDELQRFKKENNELANASALVTYSERLETELAKAEGSASRAAIAIRAELSKLFPNDVKIAELEKLKAQLGSISGSLSTDEFRKYNNEIDRQIQKLGQSREAIQAAATQARNLQSALDAALPEDARIREFNAQVEALEGGLQRGQINAIEYGIALAGLQREFDKPTLEEAARKAEALNQALGQRISTGYAEYVDEVKLLNDALVEAAGNSDLESKINLALSNIDAQIRAELTVVEGDSEDKVKASLASRKAALDQFHAERNVSVKAANADIEALEQDAARRQEDVARTLRDKLLALSGGGEAIKIGFDIQDANTELQRLFQDGEISRQQYHSAVESAEQAHQERMVALVRSGEASKDQQQKAGFNDRLAGVLQRYDKEINAAQTFADAILSARVGRERREAQEAQRVAQNDAQAYEQALAAFKANGTEENRIAAENAKRKLEISEAAAKREFEQQKKASIAQAKLSAGVAIVNAFATGGNYFVGAALAAAALINTNNVIKDIKAQQYQGSGGNYSAGTSTGADFGDTSGGQATQTQQPQTNNTTMVIVAGNIQSKEEALQIAARANRDAVRQGYIVYPNGAEPDFNNVREERLS